MTIDERIKAAFADPAFNKASEGIDVITVTQILTAFIQLEKPKTQVNERVAENMKFGLGIKPNLSR